jgi:hypothetical protein
VARSGVVAQRQRRATGTSLMLLLIGGGCRDRNRPTRSDWQTEKQRVTLKADDYDFLPSTINVGQPGEYTFVLTNEGSAEQRSLSKVAAQRATIMLAGGQERFYSPVRKHRHHGMEGLIHVIQPS